MANVRKTYVSMLHDLLKNKQVQDKLKNISFLNEKITKYIFIFLFLVLAYMITTMLWSLMPYSIQYRQYIPKNLMLVNKIEPERIYLFGKFVNVIPQLKNQKKGAEAVDFSSIKKSSLNIKITGISASTVSKKGSVALSYSGKEDVYGVGDDIKGIKNVRILRIYPTKIIIDNNETLEYVSFEDDDKKFEKYFSDTNSDKKSDDKKSELKNVRTELLGNPGALFNMLKISPYMKDGKIVGYELNPGEDTRLFINSGLKEGDIAVEINGHDLSNDAEAMKIMGQIQNLTKIEIVVERNGDRETINLDLEE
ncbi:MAG: type II secretion system protein GspC [Succinivibrionaceae bacterium]